MRHAVGYTLYNALDGLLDRLEARIVRRYEYIVGITRCGFSHVGAFACIALPRRSEKADKPALCQRS